MLETILIWIWHNLVELIGTIAGLSYIYFSIKQKIWIWPIGILSSALYIYVFFISKFYADMGLQVYYLFISFYGWYFWLNGNKTNDKRDEVPVTFTKKKMAIYLTLITFVIFVAIALILKYLTDSQVSILDSLTTAGSIVATWMLARKYLEHWLIWIVVDVISIGLYIYKGLYITVVLFVAYLIMAIVGYFQWKKSIAIQ